MDCSFFCCPNFDSHDDAVDTKWYLIRNRQTEQWTMILQTIPSPKKSDPPIDPPITLKTVQMNSPLENLELLVKLSWRVGNTLYVKWKRQQSGIHESTE